MSKRLTETSKFLSYVLRHEPQAIGLHLDREGWAHIGDLIACAKQDGRELDEALVREVVDTSDKKRFAISEDGLRIRAVQGHSTDSVSIAYVEKVPPEILYHGTATRFLDSIFREGLKPGSRQHVHLSEDVETAKAVGQRYGKPVVLKIEALRMHQQGFKFFQADNGVWLTEKVSVGYFSILNRF
jgi:putative RNA 2'-phosphotransferase